MSKKAENKEGVNYYHFGDIVIVKKNLVGIVVKCWDNKVYEVYVRSFNMIVEYHENQMKKYIHHKELTEDSLSYY